MSFSDFNIYFNQRSKFYERGFDKKDLRRIYNKLLKGKEIKLLQEKEILKTGNSLNEIFIEIPQVETVKKALKEALTDIEMIGEGTVRIVYGDYGHGKSQTAHMVLEDIIRNRRNERVYHYENISTLRDFTLHFCDNLKKQLIRNGKVLSYVENDIISLETDLYSDKISLGDMMGRLFRIMENLHRYEVQTIVFLDELDKITRDPRDLKEWVDFFQTFNDADDLSVLLVLFMPQSAAEQIRNFDRRMERWDTFFDVKGVYLDGKYASSAYKGIANISAMCLKNYRINHSEEDIELLYESYAHRREYLNNSSIRAVNIWGANIGEILNNCHDKRIWKKVEKFNKFDSTRKGLELEKRFKYLLNSDNLPEIEILLDDKDSENSYYRIKYFKENIPSNSMISDGHFKVYLRTSRSETLEFIVATEIKFTEERSHQPNQIEKMIELAKSYPVIFFSLGPPTEKLKEMQQYYSAKNEELPSLYPIQVINIPKVLLSPLMLVPDNEDAFNTVLSIVKPWSTVITNHRNELETLFKKLPSLLRDREINLNTLKLMGISPVIIDKTKTSKYVSPNDQMQKKDPMEFGIAILISFIDSINKYKRVDILERDMRKKVNSKFSHSVDEVMVRFPNMLDKLVHTSLLKYGKRGGKDTIMKEALWSKDTAMNKLTEI
ncbi:MAG: hypothetical protein GPJ54_05585 [Candidatus Heimdallarchaeota archaeon]|nr:hypothetical protein [Candidatus Heimdallarchaeota archaeon]